MCARFSRMALQAPRMHGFMSDAGNESPANGETTMSAKNRTSTKARDEKARRMAEAAERFRKSLRIETLEDRGRDALDFHDLSATQLRDAFALAFEAGYEAGLAAR